MIRAGKFTCWLACLAAAAAAAGETSTTGKFLVASHSLDGSGFAEAVILVLHHDATGAMGLIVNRPTRLSPFRAMPELRELADYPGPLYLGGPVEQDHVLALLRAPVAPPTAMEIIAGVYLIPLDQQLLGELAMDPGKLRMYLGYAGWGPGQLDGELALGSWHVVTASPQIVFSEQPGEVWRHLVPTPRFQVRTAPPALSAPAAGATAAGRVSREGTPRPAG